MMFRRACDASEFELFHSFSRTDPVDAMCSTHRGQNQGSTLNTTTAGRDGGDAKRSATRKRPPTRKSMPFISSSCLFRKERPTRFANSNPIPHVEQNVTISP